MVMLSPVNADRILWPEVRGPCSISQECGAVVADGCIHARRIAASRNGNEAFIRRLIAGQPCARCSRRRDRGFAGPSVAAATDYRVGLDLAVLVGFSAAALVLAGVRFERATANESLVHRLARKQSD